VLSCVGSIGYSMQSCSIWFEPLPDLRECPEPKLAEALWLGGNCIVFCVEPIGTMLLSLDGVVVFVGPGDEAEDEDERDAAGATASAEACSSPSAACSTPDAAALVGHGIEAAVAAVIRLPGSGDRAGHRRCVPVGLLWPEQCSGEANRARIWPL